MKILATMVLLVSIFVSTGGAQKVTTMNTLTMEGISPLTVNSGQPLPFDEDWTTGSFAYNAWEFSPNQGNWQVSMVQKSTSPAADFSGEPAEFNYSHALVSRTIDATAWNCADIWLDFDYKLVDRNSTGSEKLIVEVFCNNSLDTLLELSNLGSVAWSPKHIKINNVLQKEFRIRFRAAGINSFDIQHWYIDNINVYGICKPAENLNLTSSHFTITLTWEPPECYPNHLTKLFQWQGTPDNGYFQNYNYAYGVVYDLASYPVAWINKIDFHHASWGTTGIWQYKVHVVDWTTFSEMAVVGPMTTTGNDQWEFGVPLGDIPGVGGKLIGIMLEPMSNSPTDAYPCFSADNVGPDGVSVLVPLPNYAAFTVSTIGDFLQSLWIEIPSDGIRNPSDSGVLVGYNVYRTENYINPPYMLVTPAPLTVTFFTETFPGSWNGTARYYVTSVFEDIENETILCEAVSDTAQIIMIGMNETTAGGATVYPNPANHTVTVSAPSPIQCMRVMNMVGETVLLINEINESSFRFDVSGWIPGVYFLVLADEQYVRTVKLIAGQ